MAKKGSGMFFWIYRTKESSHWLWLQCWISKLDVTELFLDFFCPPCPITVCPCQKSLTRWALPGDGVDLSVCYL